MSCKETVSKKIKSEEKSTPSLLNNIADAISKRGLKDSLHKVDISGDDTMELEQALCLFTGSGMNHISFVSDYPKPIK